MEQSTREEWDEFCSWVYCGSEYDKDKPDTHYTFFIKDDKRLCYYFLDKPDDITNWMDITKTDINVLKNVYYKIRIKEEMCGPVLPPPSPLIKKIRASYLRQRNHYGIAI